MEGERVQVLVDLGGQLAGGGEHEGPRGPARLVGQPLEDGQDEGRGLAASRHGAGQEVLTGEGRGHGFLLDGGGAGEAELADSPEQFVVEAEAGKRHEKGLLARPAQEMSWNGDRR